ncbi:matrixin family metalloprotease [Myxococcota bacterium]|nr:matrixin family metalloprotease [Myxococcota bacterium]MBU1382163.1 matrixin family metalloprotease [Myxococcota bacterium]
MLKNIVFFLFLAGLSFEAMATSCRIPEGSDPSNHPECHQIFIHPLDTGSCIPYNLMTNTESPVIFLNFEGAVIKRASFDNPETDESWIPDYETVDIPPFDHTPFIRDNIDTREAVIEAVVNMVRHYFAPFDIIITRKRPPSGSKYTMMMIGGSGSLITANPGAMVGVSPFDCGNRSKSDIAYTFSDDLSNIHDIVTTITHESGHNLGLAHVDNVSAVMNPYVTSDPYWGNGVVPDGSACDGGSTQDSFEVLGENLGLTPDREAPWVDFVMPSGGSKVPSTVGVLAITGDEHGLGRYVELFVDGESKGEKTYPYFSWRINNLTEGSHTLQAVVKDEGGNSSSTTIKVTVDGACTDQDFCDDGKRGIGENCSSEKSCNLSTCVENGDGSWCSIHCTPETAGCAPGMVCLPEEGGNDYYCGYGSGELSIKSTSKDHLIGCSSYPGKQSSSILFLVTLLSTFMFGFRRRYTK